MSNGQAPAEDRLSKLIIRETSKPPASEGYLDALWQEAVRKAQEAIRKEEQERAEDAGKRK